MPSPRLGLGRLHENYGSTTAVGLAVVVADVPAAARPAAVVAHPREPLPAIPGGLSHRLLARKDSLTGPFTDLIGHDGVTSSVGELRARGQEQAGDCHRHHHEGEERDQRQEHLLFKNPEQRSSPSLWFEWPFLPAIVCRRGVTALRQLPSHPRPTHPM